MPRQQLLGQHREISALRGKGWNKKHRTVDYVFKYSLCRLFSYHKLVMAEMIQRGYKPNPVWEQVKYRGKNCNTLCNTKEKHYNRPVYAEHDEDYLNECLENLKGKGVNINMEVTI